MYVIICFKSLKVICSPLLGDASVTIIKSTLPTKPMKFWRLRFSPRASKQIYDWKKHEHFSKLHEQHSHCFDLSEKIHIKSRSTNLPLVPKLCQELSVKIPANRGHSCLHPRLQWYGWRTLATWNHDSNLALNTKTSKTLPQPKQLKQHLYHTNRISFDWSSFRPRAGPTPTSTQFFFSGAAASMTSAKLPPFASSWGSNTSETIHKR